MSCSSRICLLRISVRVLVLAAMTVTFSVSSVSVSTQEMTDTVQGPLSDTKILGMACGPQSRLCREMLQSSITEDERARLSPRTNGFVRSVLAAYAGHYHLRMRLAFPPFSSSIPHVADMYVITVVQMMCGSLSSASLVSSKSSGWRPCILDGPSLTRDSVNAHAEELRQYFVAHEETKTLVVQDIGTRYSVDFGHLARLMTGHIHKNVSILHVLKWASGPQVSVIAVDIMHRSWTAQWWNGYCPTSPRLP